MDYCLQFFEKGKLQKIIKESVHMYGKGGKFVSCNVSPTYDTMMLFDEDVRFIITYYRVGERNGMSVFKRN